MIDYKHQVLRSSYFKEIADGYLPSSRRSFAYQNTLIFNTKRKHVLNPFSVVTIFGFGPCIGYQISFGGKGFCYLSG